MALYPFYNDSSNNSFTIDYYVEILEKAIKFGYQFMTMLEYIEKKPENKLIFILRHDLDTKPQSLLNMLEAERKLGVRSTIFVRVLTDEYNIYGFKNYLMLKNAYDDNFEIALHTSCCEFAKICNLSPFDSLRIELNTIRSMFDVKGIAPHRDINYMYNSLPFIEKYWKDISNEFNLTYQGYSADFMSNLTFVNEGLNPHLGWRSISPNIAINDKKSIYLSTHSHWWFKSYAFEH
jgi:hypothetical protein